VTSGAFKTADRLPQDKDCNKYGWVYAKGRCGENDWRPTLAEHVHADPKFYTEWMPLAEVRA